MSTTPTMLSKRLLNSVLYVLKPMNAKTFKIETPKILKLLVLDMKGFRYYRTWGKWNDKPTKIQKGKQKK